MIRFDELTKRYGSRTAVDRLTLHVGAGEVVALLGPNGSGKTTTLKVAAGLTRPTSGTAMLGSPGRAASDPAARALISFLPQRVAFPESLTGREVVDFYRELRRVPAARTADALKFASLNGASDRAVSTYSGGMAQRLGLAVAMLPDAPVLLLDEPTAALDPDGLSAFYALIDRRQQSGGTVLFTSHHLGDAERLADRFAILVEGRLVAVLTNRELADRLASRGVMRLRLDGCTADALRAIGAIAPDARLDGDELVVPGAPSDRAAVLEIVRLHGATIRGLTAEEGRLDTFYRELVADSAAELGAKDRTDTKDTNGRIHGGAGA